MEPTNSARRTRANVAPVALVAGALVALFGVVSVALFPDPKPVADMRIEPARQTALIENVFTVTVLVESTTPVNVFAGEVTYDPDLLSIDHIDYNSAAADLWAEEPWYNRGEGTVHFAGGTTRSGGFTGSAELLSVTFRAEQSGAGAIGIENARILMHDGLGTDATVRTPIDSLFSVEETLERDTVLQKSVPGSTVQVASTPPSTDLNHDGKQGIADVSVFMMHLVAKNPASDFNQDGTVNTADLSILLNTL